MLLSFVMSALFRPRFVWVPALELDDPQVVSTLFVDYGR
jgi:hypothetical protein